MRQRAKPLVQFLVGAINCSAAIYVGWRAKFAGDRIQRHSFADHFFARTPCSALLPFEVWRERNWVYVLELARRRIVRTAHRTFATTNVRSSASGAPCVNQSTSRRIRSAISVADGSWSFSIISLILVAPNNCFSLFIVSAIPSD